LVKVVSGSHSPFPVVVSENVVAEVELGGVTVGLSGFRTVSVNSGRVVEVVSILTLAGFVTKVIEASSSVTAEMALGKGQ